MKLGMKRLLSLCLAAVLMFGFAGCTSDPNANKTSQTEMKVAYGKDTGELLPKREMAICC